MTNTDYNSDGYTILDVKECSICLENISSKPSLLLDCCKSEIHKECIYSWINKPGVDINCPNCRTTISSKLVKKAQVNSSKYPDCLFTMKFCTLFYCTCLIGLCVGFFSIPKDS